MSVNKNELVTMTAARAGVTKKDATAVLEALLDTVVEELSEGREVLLVGFGKFCVAHRAEREAYNPQTREKILVPAVTVPKFVAAKNLKLKIAGGE